MFTKLPVRNTYRRAASSTLSRTLSDERRSLAAKSPAAGVVDLPLNGRDALQLVFRPGQQPLVSKDLLANLSTSMSEVLGDVCRARMRRKHG
jgi:hypothetical protein